MGVPYTFGTATTSIPLSNLDANFNTPVTIGNATVGLGNTVTTVGNLTLTNATISSGNVTVTTGIFGAGSNTAPSITTTGDTNTGIFFPAADTIAFTEGGVEAMRIDSSGNVGIGTSSPTTPLNIVRNASGQQSVLLSNNNAGTSGASAFVASNGTNEIRLLRAGTGYSSYGAFTSSDGAVYSDQSLVLMSDNASGIIKFASGGNTERMRIDSSGNLGIGTSSPSSFAATTNLALGTGSSGAALTVFTGTAQTGAVYFADGTTSADRYRGAIEYSHSSNALLFTTDASERMRITSAGVVCVNRTSDLGAVKFVVESDTTTVNPMTVSNTRSTASTDYSILFYRNGSIVGSVQTSLSATSFVTSSDYRLKENVVPMTGALTKVAQLKPCTYTWKTDGSNGEGFIAHELQEFAPYAVSGVKDGEQMQGVDYGKITPLLTAALQEALAKIESLEARLAVLESK